jgi:crotonobetainyl-CoA:carnitine CoA-transferase CaiB-like acyl-CoA transferase
MRQRRTQALQLHTPEQTFDCSSARLKALTFSFMLVTANEDGQGQHVSMSMYTEICSLLGFILPT